MPKGDTPLDISKPFFQHNIHKLIHTQTWIVYITWGRRGGSYAQIIPKRTYRATVFPDGNK